ncbi:MAG: hypothetical protein RIS29_3136 [Bacteroidota bacterium]|jgi:hypothetical protein
MLLIAVGLSAASVFAQSDLQISKAFEQYGNKKGSVYVELTNEALGNYDFSLFKSLTISNNVQAAELIRHCLAKDEAGARKVKQVVVSGVPTSIYLQLPKKGQLYRLILFNETRKGEQKVTLIYIESETDSEDILKFILKKK